MIIGRVVRGVAMLVCMGLSGEQFSFELFVAGAITNAIPGIILQIILIPLLVMGVEQIRS